MRPRACVDHATGPRGHDIESANATVVSGVVARGLRRSPWARRPRRGAQPREHSLKVGRQRARGGELVAHAHATDVNEGSIEPVPLEEVLSRTRVAASLVAEWGMADPCEVR